MYTKNKLVIAVPSNGCNDLFNINQINGNVALIQRG